MLTSNLTLLMGLRTFDRMVFIRIKSKTTKKLQILEKLDNKDIVLFGGSGGF